MKLAVGWEKKDGESANWVPHRPDLRPFDLVYREDSDSKWQGLDFGFSDPTRMGLLRDNQQYYAKGKSASRMVSKKRLDYSGTINTYGPLKRDVDYRPVVLEVSAGLGDKAHVWWAPPPWELT